MKKQIRELIRIAEAQGWEVTPTNSSHLRWRGPEGHGLVFTPSTPSDWRSIKNATAQLRRAGLKV
jgi:hypothetical protein